MPLSALQRTPDQLNQVAEKLGGIVPPEFVYAFLGRGSSEDLGRHDTTQLAWITRQAWGHLEHVPQKWEPVLRQEHAQKDTRESATQQRKKSQTSVRITDPDLRFGEGHRDEVTVIEIINDDKPFLLDSTLAELNEQGLEILLVLHPIFALERDENGKLLQFHGDALVGNHDGRARESLIHIHVLRIDSEDARRDLEQNLYKTFSEVDVAVADWRPMRARLDKAVSDFRNHPIRSQLKDVREAVEFLDWLSEDNFTFLGLREYRFAANESGFEPVTESGLGILRNPDVRVLRKGTELVVMTPEIREFLEEPSPLIITKANVKSRVHRRVHMDYIGIKTFSEQGTVDGELRLVGLFTSTAYTRSTRSVPLLRNKVDAVLARAGFDPEAHSGKALLNVLESYPRDELFQIEIDDLYTFSLDVLTLYERPRLRVLPRIDRFDRFVSIIVYVPRERYDSEVRIKIGQYLARVYEGRLSAAYPSYPEGPLARVHFIIGRYVGTTPRLDRQTLEEDIADIVRTWPEKLRDALTENSDGARARKLAARYGSAFSAGYREAFSPQDAVRDIHVLERLTSEHPRSLSLYRRARDNDTRVSLKLFSYQAPMPLSDRVPVLEAMGFRVVNERTYRVEYRTEGDIFVWLHDMTLERARGGAIALNELGEKIQACIYAVFAGEAESDGFNTLILEAGLGWREVVIVRALARYLRQARIPYSQDYLWATLSKYAALSREFIALFHARFDPHNGLSIAEREKEAQSIKERIMKEIEAISSLDEDRILRRFLNLIEAIVRTNFYQVGKNGLMRETISFKIRCALVSHLPEPKPLFEIFVYCPRVEGIHLRFGKVARGGLRWSDRLQDYRTEVLGLVKAQQVKNAVIVPVGAKGGFVPLKLPQGPREAIQLEGTESYKIFVSSLLHLTDNLEGDTITPPANTVRWDEADAYLVVAADKGTATFSDTANGLSQNHGFWLDDAFASGGSAGYDHKKMGITARGGWEAVKRHFREMNVYIQTTPFTVAGVGDMSGDVFGNGMLLSEKIRLLAAFDHRDIFLDPNPDPATSFAERQRMFDLPRSSWADYNTALISKGGGIFSRSAKSIPLSTEVQAMLGIAVSELAPNDLMNAILKMNVDLMWFGGIGTYVRASSETDTDAGDRANDALRIAAPDLRCKVIGEGANLGMTQRARIEAAQHGVRINTDAIDNSAGVNSSDVEVNIKICLSKPEQEKRFTRDERNVLLAKMTDEVAQLVLRNNYLQSLALSLSERRGSEDIGFAIQFMRNLEARGRLNRAVEYLPTDEELSARERAGKGLTRPEIAVLLAYAKLTLYDDLLASSVPDDPYLSKELVRYFPNPIRETYPDAIEAHRLRREIIATALTNAVINRGGATLLTRLGREVMDDPTRAAYGFAAVRDSFGLLDLNNALDQLDNKIDGAVQLELYGKVQNLLIDRLKWFSVKVDFARGLEPLIAEQKAAIAAVRQAFDASVPARLRQSIEAQTQQSLAYGVPAELAAAIAQLEALRYVPDALDIISKIKDQKPNTADVFRQLLAIYEQLSLSELLASASKIKVQDHFDRLARERGLERIEAAARRIVARAITQKADAIQWLEKKPETAKTTQTMMEMAKSGWSVSKLTVAAAMLDDLSEG